MYNIGVILNNGAPGLPPDAVEAERYFQQAADGG